MWLCLYVVVCMIPILTILRNKIMKNNPPLPKMRKKYPFRNMEPGDFEYIEFENIEDLLLAQKAAGCAKSKNGYRFITRKTGLGLNVWCTEVESAFWD